MKRKKETDTMTTHQKHIIPSASRTVHIAKEDETRRMIPALERSPNYQRLHSDLGNRVVMLLSTLTKDNSSMFVTANDLAHELIRRSSVCISERETADFCLHVNAILVTKHQNKNKTRVHRTEGKIPSKHGKMAYGYRIGPALNIPIRDMDERVREKANNVVTEVLSKQFDQVFADMLATRTMDQLLSYQALLLQEIGARTQARDIELARLKAQLENLQK